MTAFRMPAGPGESELTEKRSRFYGHLTPIETEDEARSFIRTIQKQFHDARHNCWCYRIYGGTERFSDDGEPSGSAGGPMLEVFRREDVWNYVCVVTRYFGGVLLGTGGLSRAYGGAAKAALEAAGCTSTGLWRAITLTCPYALLDRLKRMLENEGAELEEPRYGTEVEMVIWVPEDRSAMLPEKIRDFSGGRIEARPASESVRR